MQASGRGATGERGGAAAEGAELRPDAAEEGRRLVQRPRQLLLVALQHAAVGLLRAAAVAPITCNNSARVRTGEARGARASDERLAYHELVELGVQADLPAGGRGGAPLPADLLQQRGHLRRRAHLPRQIDQEPDKLANA